MNLKQIYFLIYLFFINQIAGAILNDSPLSPLITSGIPEPVIEIICDYCDEFETTAEYKWTDSAHYLATINDELVVSIWSKFIYDHGQDRNIIVIFNIKNKQVIKQFRIDADAYSLIVLPNNKIGIGDNKKRISVWDIYTGQMEYELLGHSSSGALSVINLALLSDSILASNNNREIIIWDINNKKIVHKMDNGHWFHHIKKLTSNLLLVCDDRNQIQILDVNSGKVTKTIKSVGYDVHHILNISDNIICAAAGSCIQYWDVNTAKLLKEENLGTVTIGLLILPNNKIAAANLNEIKIVDKKTLKQYQAIAGSWGTINKIIITSSGELISSHYKTGLAFHENLGLKLKMALNAKKVILWENYF